MYHISHKIKKPENNIDFFYHIIEKIKNSDLIIWSFGLWVLAVPAQFMRFVELIKERKVENTFNDKFTAVISTSIHFYDHTAHNYMRAVCEDMNMQYIEGISFDMLDLMKTGKRKDLITFYENIYRTVKEKKIQTRTFTPLKFYDFDYEPSYSENKIKTFLSVLIL